METNVKSYRIIYTQTMLAKRYKPDEFEFEIGVDEAGRGPLFGRLYVAAVVLPKDDDFHHEWMKDSKKFHSKKKIKMVSDYIKEHALAWTIQYIEHDVIDTINIRQAVHRGMHKAIQDIFEKNDIPKSKTFLLIDGNDFRPFTHYDEVNEEIKAIPHETIKGGDNKYTHIAAASILAKVARDEYIHELCIAHPLLDERYGVDKNQGYGTKQHLEGIEKHGISQWHRQSYGRCNDAQLNAI